MKMLGAINNLVNSLELHGIRYCHFKSNEHLDAALQGDTDLDILFESERQKDTEKVLLANGFIRMSAVGLRKYRGIEDYIGIDEETGKVIHVHGHFLLVGGESGVKPYHIKMEEGILASARYYADDCPVYVCSPEMEMLLLIVRTALKQKIMHGVFSVVRDKEYKGDTKREFLWLKDRVDIESFMKCIPDYMQSGSNQVLFERIVSDGITHRSSRRFFVENKRLFSQWRYLGIFQAAVIRMNYFLFKVKRKLGILKSRPFFRTLEGRGVVVAILGADGVGKSTQNRLVPLELRKKMDVLYMYMGAGDGEASWHRYPLKLLASVGRFLKFKLKKPVVQSNDVVSIMQYGVLKRCYKILWAISLAFERKSKLQKIEKWKSQGGIVVCDRYPQSFVLGFNDGPLLGEYLESSGSLMRLISRWEDSVYRMAGLIAPDLVIKLWADIDELRVRRPEMTAELIQKKQSSILDLQFPESTRVVKIKSTGGESSVFPKIMKEIHEVFTINFLRQEKDDS